jgi:DNA-binding GntR family transcriptional regulator
MATAVSIGARASDDPPRGRSREPVYLRVLEDLRSRIHAGVLAPGARVPSRNAIITNYGVGETAAKHALQVLISEGLIEPRPGSGCYVRRAPAAVYLEHDRPQFPGSPFGVDELVAAEHQNGSGPGSRPTRKLTWEHQTEQVDASPAIAEKLGIAPAELVVMTTYLMRADGEPVQLAVSSEPAEITAGTAVEMPEQGPLAGRGVAERMRSIGIEVDEVTEEMSVRPALVAEADELAVPAGSALLVVERVHHSGRRPVAAAEVLVPADKFRLRYRFAVGRPDQ